MAQAIKNSPANPRDAVLFPESRSPGGRHGNPLQFSGLENSMDCIVHGVAESRTQLSNFHFSFIQEKGESSPSD